MLNYFLCNSKFNVIYIRWIYASTKYFLTEYVCVDAPLETSFIYFHILHIYFVCAIYIFMCRINISHRRWKKDSIYHTVDISEILWFYVGIGTRRRWWLACMKISMILVGTNFSWRFLFTLQISQTSAFLLIYFVCPLICIKRWKFTMVVYTQWCILSFSPFKVIYLF